MKEIEKFISPFTEQLFPSFYREEGPNFVAFVKAYYEWLESNNETLYHTRRLPDYKDIDKTIEDFIIFFKQKYLSNIQFTTASNKRLFIKNALDFYRAKGTERAVDLFFKLIHGIEAQVYYPGDDLFRLSNNQWIRPTYFELDRNDKNILYVGKTIEGAASGARAFVERLIKKRVDTRYIDVLFITNIEGNFETGENIQVIDGSTTHRARIRGSLTSIELTYSEPGFSVGDSIYITDGSGRRGKALVKGTEDKIGTVLFKYVDGGYGYMIDADYETITGNSQILVAESTLISNTITMTDTNLFTRNTPFKRFDTVKQNIYQLRLDTTTGDDPDSVIRGISVYGKDALDANVFSGEVISVSRLAATNTMIMTISYESGDTPVDTSSVYTYSNTEETIGTVDQSYYIIRYDTEVTFVVGEYVAGETSGANAEIIYSYPDDNIIYVAKSDVDFQSGEDITSDSANSSIVSSSIIDYTLRTRDALATGNVISSGTTCSIEYEPIDAGTPTLTTNYVIYQKIDEPTQAGNGARIYSTGIIQNTGSIGTTKIIDVIDVGGAIRTDENFYCTINDVEYEFSITRMYNMKFDIIDVQNTFYPNVTVYSDNIATEFVLYTKSVGTGASFEITEIEGTEEIFTDDVLIGDYANVVLSDVWDMPGDESASISSSNSIINVLDGSYQTIGRVTEILQTSPGAGYSESPAVVLYNKFSQGMEVFDYVLRVEPTPGSNFTNGENVIGQTSNTAGRVEFYSSAQGLLYLTRLSMTDEYIDGERVVGEFSGNDTTITKVLERGATFLSPKIGRTGINATVLADTSSGIGFINELQISDSGFGYKQDDEVVMLSEDFPTKLARGVLSLGDGVGIGQGHYKNREGFLSADKYIHDGYFYQEYSYQVLTALPFNDYSDVLRKVLHVAGTEPFGKYVSSSVVETDVTAESEIAMNDFTPAMLFTDGQDGFWFDPSSSTRVFQDSSSVTPAEVAYSDPIGSMRSVVNPTKYRAVQTTATKRPVGGSLKNLVVFPKDLDNNIFAWSRNNVYFDRNSLTYSEDLSQSVWGKENSTITSGIQGPNSINAYKVQDKVLTVAGGSGIARNYNFVKDIKYTSSIYVKAGSQSRIVLVFSNITASTSVRASFDLINGVLVSESAYSDGAGIESHDDGWYRCWLSVTSEYDIYGAFSFQMQDEEDWGGLGYGYIGDGTGYMYMGGIQMVLGSLPLPYVKTEDTTQPIQYLAPDGSLTAERIMPSDTQTVHYIDSYLLHRNFNNGEKYASSLFIKNAGWDEIAIRMYYAIGSGDGKMIRYSFSSNNIIYSNADDEYIEYLDDGWIRIGMVNTVEYDDVYPNKILYRLQLYGYDGVTPLAGDGASGAYIWGAMLEQSNSVNEYTDEIDVIVKDFVDDDLVISFDEDFDGNLIVATREGTLNYPVHIPSGEFNLLDSGAYQRKYNREFVGAVLVNDITPEDESRIYEYYSNKIGNDLYGEKAYSPVMNMSAYWRYFSEMKEFPYIDTSFSTNFSSAWQYCSSLTSFPLIDTSIAITLNAAWSNCTSLTSFPQINTASVEDMYAAWYDCTSLTEFPLIDTSSVTRLSYAWSYCRSLESFPLIDTSSVTNAHASWQYCETLTSFPEIDTSSVTNMGYAWKNCISLTSFPLIDTSSVTRIFLTWQNCTSLTSFPLIDTSSVTDMYGAWQNCTSLTSFPAIDTSSTANCQSSWSFCSSMTDFPANVFDNTPCTNFFNAFYNCALSQTSVDNILVSINTAGTSGGTLTLNGGTSSAPSATGLAAKSALEGRGWTVTTN